MGINMLKNLLSVIVMSAVQMVLVGCSSYGDTASNPDDGGQISYRNGRYENSRGQPVDSRGRPIEQK